MAKLGVKSRSDDPPANALPGGAATPAVAERPHMPKPVVAWLEARLRESSCFLEFGSGGSTRLAAAVGVPTIVSVESDAAFARTVRDAVRGTGSRSRLHLIRVDIGRTKEWGFPESFTSFLNWPTYSLAAWDFMREKSLRPDLILIDGRFRLGCFFSSLLEAPAGTPILFDDYLLRREIYGCVEAILRPSELIKQSAIFIVPQRIRKREIARAFARHVSNPM